jgi:hypothetical protein
VNELTPNRYKDAERDCSTAISLAKGDVNVKALYRRAIARKSLDHLEGAIEGELIALCIASL